MPALDSLLTPQLPPILTQRSSSTDTTPDQGLHPQGRHQREAVNEAVAALEPTPEPGSPGTPSA